MKIVKCISTHIDKYVYKDAIAHDYIVMKYSITMYECIMNNYETAFVLIPIDKFNNGTAAVLVDIIRYFVIYNKIAIDPHNHIEFEATLNNVHGIFANQKMPKHSINASTYNLRIAFKELSRDISYSKIAHEYLKTYLTKHLHNPQKLKNIHNSILRANKRVTQTDIVKVYEFINLKIGTIDESIIQSTQIQVGIISACIVDLLRMLWFIRNNKVNYTMISYVIQNIITS
jgi:hypothetical protein